MASLKICLRVDIRRKNRKNQIVPLIHHFYIRPPRLDDGGDGRTRQKGFRPLYDIPWMYEAREFLRKKLIGHNVQVVVYFYLQYISFCVTLSSRIRECVPFFNNLCYLFSKFCLAQFLTYSLTRLLCS